MHSQVGGDKHVAHTLKRSEQLCLKKKREKEKPTDHSLLEKPPQEQTSQEHKGDKTRFISTHHTHSHTSLFHPSILFFIYGSEHIALPVA